MMIFNNRMVVALKIILMIPIPTEAVQPAITEPLPNQTAVAKGHEFLKFMKKQGELDDESIAWLKVATDPWHDTPIDHLCGLPDSTTGKSICFSSISQIELSKPSGFGAGNWDVQISNYPVLNTQTMSEYTRPGPNTTDTNFASTGTADSVSGPVIIQSKLGGNNFPYPSSGGNPAVFNTTTLAPNPEHLVGNARCIGMAIEVINTTSPLYVQGLCTATRFNQGDLMPSTIGVINSGNTSLYGFPSVYWAKAPPNNLSAQTLNQQVSQWHAKEGAYSVIPIKVTEDSNLNAVPLAMGLFTEEFNNGTDANPPVVAGLTFGPRQYSSSVAVAGINLLTGFRSVAKRFPCDSVCLSFTGLSEQTTLTIRARWIIERFPTEAQPEMVVLAKPCARYSPTAFEIYRKIAQRLPPAVMFRENPAGEWWKRVIGTIGKIGGPLLSFIPGVGGLASSLANTGSQMLLDSADADRKQRKAFNKANPSKAINSKGKKKKKKKAALAALPAGWENKAYNAQVRPNGTIVLKK